MSMILLDHVTKNATGTNTRRCLSWAAAHVQTYREYFGILGKNKCSQES